MESPDRFPDPVPSQFSAITWHPRPGSWTDEAGWAWEAHLEGAVLSTPEAIKTAIEDFDAYHNAGLRLEVWLAPFFGMESFILIANSNDPKLNAIPVDEQGRPTGKVIDNHWRTPPHIHPLFKTDCGLIYHKDSHHVMLVFLDGLGFIDKPVLVPLTGDTA